MMMMTSVRTSMTTILKFMVHVIRRQRPLWEKRCQCALTTSRRGCAATVCNWTLRKLRYCGARPADSNTRSLGNLHVSAPISCSLSDQYATWAYIDSNASMKAHVSRTVSSCFNVLRQIRSIRRSVTCPFLQSFCCVFSIVSTRLRQRSTRRLACPRTEQFSQFRMLARGSSRQTIAITFHRYFATSTGCGRRSESTRGMVKTATNRNGYRSKVNV